MVHRCSQSQHCTSTALTYVDVHIYSWCELQFTVDHVELISDYLMNLLYNTLHCPPVQSFGGFDEAQQLHMRTRLGMGYVTAHVCNHSGLIITPDSGHHLPRLQRCCGV